MSLDERTIDGLQPRETKYMVHDRLGLYIVVMPSGNKFWRFRYKFNKKNNQFSIGPYSKRDGKYIRLSDARMYQAGYITWLKKGVDPMDFRVEMLDNYKRRKKK